MITAPQCSPCLNQWLTAWLTKKQTAIKSDEGHTILRHQRFLLNWMVTKEFKKVILSCQESLYRKPACGKQWLVTWSLHHYISAVGKWKKNGQGTTKLLAGTVPTAHPNYVLRGINQNFVPVRGTFIQHVLCSAVVDQRKRQVLALDTHLTGGQAKYISPKEKKKEKKEQPDAHTNALLLLLEHTV